MSYPLHEFAGNRVTASDNQSIQGIDSVFEGRGKAGMRKSGIRCGIFFSVTIYKGIVLVFSTILDTRYLFFTLRLI
ncbi:hypothetical protein C0W35_12120 [Photobacterium kishitanii]|nr:hypothetical protein C0W35_12120 [Photobacterium kishitanii]